MRTTNLSRRGLLAGLGGATVAGAGLLAGATLGSGRADAATLSPRATFDVRDYGARPNSGLDDTSAFQAAVAACFAAGGGVVYVPPFRFTAVCDLQVGVHLVGDGYQSQICAPTSGPNTVGAGRPIIGSGGRDLWFHGVRNLAIIGGRQAGTHERGIEFISTNGDAHANGVGGSPNDPKPTIQGVYLQDTGAEGIYLGTNMRGARVHDVQIFHASGNGLSVVCSDSWFSNISVGATFGTGAAILVTGSCNQFVNCKAWQGADKGWFVNGASLISLANCVSNDNANYGLWVQDGQVIAPGFLSDGDQYPCYVSSTRGYPYGAGSDIDLTVSIVDRYQPVYGIAVNNVRNNRFRVRLLYSVMKTGPQPPAADRFATFQMNGPPSDVFTNVFEYATHDAAQVPVATKGVITPDAYDGLTVFVPLTATTWITPLIDRKSIAPGREITFVFTQDGTGGHLVVWDKSYGGTPVVTPTPGAVTAIRFINASTTLTPAWRLA